MLELENTSKVSRNAQISKLLDDAGFRLLDHLEGKSGDMLRARNKANPDSAITTFTQAVENRRSQAPVNKRFLRAKDNYKRRYAENHG
jgi:hypothetical protein